MYQRRRARVVLAILVMVSLVLITIDFRSGEGGPMNSLRGMATTVFGPVQEGLAAVVRPIGNALGDVGDVFSLRAENDRLQQALEELSERRRSFSDLERENSALRDLLEMRDRTDLEVVAARVVALGSSNYEWTVTIDVGAVDGVERNMVVINGDGLVGRVIQVTANASRVLLAIDPNFSAAASIADLGEKGPISGRGAEPLQFLPLDPEVEIELGSEIVTSAYSNGVFPAGIPIGKVAEVGEASTLLTREVLVRPFVDFTRLDFVMVVLHSPVVAPTDVPDSSENLPFTPPVPIPPSPSPDPDAEASPTPDAETG